MRTRNPQGNIYIPVLVTMTLFVSLGIIATTYVGNQAKLANQKKYKAITFNIAEAGAEYYRWHLAHAQQDYQDGTGTSGPYTHDYYNAAGDVMGQFVLDITAPPNGSTIVNILSTGHSTEKPLVTKTVKVKMGIPSFTNYAVAANDVMRFGEGTEVYGPIHSNNGIRFDGLAHNVVTSHVSTYDDPDHTGAVEFGVHTHDTDTSSGTSINNTFRSAEAPPNTMPNRSDVFMAGREVGVASIDFDSITSDLSDMQTASQPPDGIHLGSSGGLGYHITLHTNGTLDIRVVNSTLRCQYYSGSSWRDFGYCSQNFYWQCYQNSGSSGTGCSYCTNDPGWHCSSNGDCNGRCSGNQSRSCSNNSTCINYGEGLCVTGASCTTAGVSCVQSSHSIGTVSGSESSFTYQGQSSIGLSFPTNGLIFAEDDLWVDGAVDNARLTIVAAKTPLATGNANIYLNRDLTYTPVGDTSGNDALGLIAQSNILVGYYSEDDLHIDGALIAQHGLVGRPYYGAGFTTSTNTSNFRRYPTSSPDPMGQSSCLNYRSQSTITASGSLGTYQRYGFAWTGYNLYNCGGGQYNNSGYCTRNLIYDDNFYFAPPPYFPTTGQYRIISWEEE